MTAKHKKTDLSDCEGSEIRLEFAARLGGFIFRCVCLKDEIDDRLSSFVAHFRSGESVIAFVELITDVTVHFFAIPPFHVPASYIEIFQGIDTISGFMPADLTQHAICKRVVARLCS